MAQYAIDVKVRCKCGATAVVETSLGREMKAGDFGVFYSGRMILNEPPTPKGWGFNCHGIIRCGTCMASMLPPTPKVRKPQAKLPWWKLPTFYK